MGFSDSLEEYDEAIENSYLRGSLIYLEKLCEENYKVLKFQENFIAIQIKLSVNLPSRGNKDDIDIRSEEPIFIIFHLHKYPQMAPIVFTDRLDFPKNDIAHLYVAVNGWPPAICYTRGKMDDWYADKRIEDLISRIRNWFQEAAIGELNENGDEFDPQRIENSSGTMVFDYDHLTQQVSSGLAENTHLSAVFEHREDKKKKIAAQVFTFEKILSNNTKVELVELIKNEWAKDNQDKTKRTFTIGGVFWSSDHSAISTFKIDLPSTFGELKSYAAIFGVAPEAFESFLTSVPLIEKNIPIILAVKRPKQLYGFSAEYEFLCFQLIAKTTFANGMAEINESTIVKQLVHKQPLTRVSARRISGESIVHTPAIVYGCGALGSKVVEHLSRSGLHPFLLVDPDDLAPHNLVRHSLDSKSVGLNKASELAKKIQALFYPEHIEIFGRAMLSDVLLEKFDGLWLLDFTASTNFANERIIKSVFKQRFIRTAISDSGNVSYILKEGSNGNPRIDDLEVSLYYHSIFNHQVSSWLNREKEIASEGGAFLRVGIGCSSETTIIADDTISLHGALASRILKHEIGSTSDEGKVYFQDFNLQSFSLNSTSFEVGRFDLFEAKNDNRWKIRFAAGIIDSMRKAMKSVGRNETGGVLIGVANYKTMTIHVVDMIHLPDSSASPIHYLRKSEGLPKRIFEVVARSGGQLGYVGEWHTHPVGPEFWSSIDQAEMERLKTEHSKMVTPLPVFMTIVTKTNIHPYVL